MEALEIYKRNFSDFIAVSRSNKYEWAATNVFDLTTYDGDLDELFVKKIIEVCKIIMERKNFEYIRNESDYVTFIIACQLLEKFNWIEWGTSIRGAWLEENDTRIKSRPILEHWDSGEGLTEIPFTIDNLKTLIEFIEEESEVEE